MAVKMPQLLDMCFSADVVPVMELMRQELGFRPTDARRVLRRAPQVLLPRQDGSTPVDTIAALQALGLKPKMVSMEVIRWPRLLTYSPASLMELATWLGSAEVGMRAASDDSSAVSLNVLRQAPWLAEHDLETQLRPVARYLQESLGIRDMQRVLRAYPQILCCSITKDLEPRVWFLTEEVGINEEDVPRVVQTFPLLFAVPVERMRGVYGLLASELLITRPDITKIVRAFPSLLGLEPEKHVRAVVAYMRSLGIQNIGRFVSRLPPVLGYDVSNNLMPKMDYLVAMMGLSVYDVLTFPAYFSYPLESIIEPRTEFLKLRRRPIAVVGLNMALTSGDADFAKKIAKVRPELYASFKAAYMKHRAEVQAGTMKGEDLLEMLGLDMLGGKPLGSLGGLSTSSNVQEVTSARQLADDEVAAKFGPDGSAQQQDGERDAQGG
ncbi:mTERF-domain-containing protein [Tribonema minus]|uniref:mTERF-domain-containing protein n=1 Tax=Tribonema minus TaxID=303371 RepID=A0A835Z724_9STRA|nr:mTERF-domain-containing protein [Tribonema minus]